ncbi:EKA-like protein [Blumeria hordei DH14]|uniref:EKA-like protein n=1 Tax=Blumeria graminis f. sp. hordei (strain DH14) TaxID=546991 RepID=N1JKJ8_BLUG1|nr:EKA-like protein [Blumeria hordei DH14]
MSKVSIKGKEKALSTVTEPDTDMIGSVIIIEEIPQRVSIPHGIGESSKFPPTASKPSENAAPKAAGKSGPLLRRNLWHRSNSSFFDQWVNRLFVDSMGVYLRAAIAQYMATGLASTPHVLPPRPANSLPRAPDARSIQIPAIPALPLKSTWATVVKNGLPQKAVPIAKAIPQPAAKAPRKETPKAKVDKQLFLRLEKDHPWRKFSTSCVRTRLEYTFKYFGNQITSLHRVRTGFAMLAKNDTIRQETLDGSSKLV